MPLETTNLKLKKPLPEEYYDVGVFNDNFDKIDEKIATLQNYDDTDIRQQISTKSDKTYVDEKLKLKSDASYVDESLMEVQQQLREALETMVVDFSEMTNYTLTHSKSGTVHTLSDLPTGQGIYQCQFIATNTFYKNDTFNGFSVKPTGEEYSLPDKAFISGDLVSVIVDTRNHKLGFKIGGGSKSQQIKITVSTSQPSGAKHGDFWVKDSGYSLEGVYGSINEPSSIPNNFLFICTGVSATSNKTKLVEGKKIVLETFIKYGKVYRNGRWYEPQIYVYNGSWQDISTSHDGLFVIAHTSSSGYKTYEYDPKTLSQVRSIPNSWDWRLGGISNRIFQYSNNNIREVDLKTFSVINSAAIWDVYDVGGTKDKLFVTVGSFSHPIKEIDPDTLAVIKTSNEESPHSSRTWHAMGGTSDTLYVSLSSSWRDVPRIVAKVDKSNLTTYSRTETFLAGSSKVLTGTSNDLFAVEGSRYDRIAKLDPHTYSTLALQRVDGEIVGIGGTK